MNQSELANNTINQSELDANTRNRYQARKNSWEVVTNGFSFTFDWSRKWRQIFQPITEQRQSEVKQK